MNVFLLAFLSKKSHRTMASDGTMRAAFEENDRKAAD